jgi:hypothetical protein
MSILFMLNQLDFPIGWPGRMPATWMPAVIGMLVSGPFTRLLSAMEHPEPNALILDAEGITASVGGRRSLLRWSDIDGFSTKDGFLAAEAASLTRRQAAWFHHEVARRYGADSSALWWSRKRPRALIAPTEMDSASWDKLINAIEQFWPGSIGLGSDSAHDFPA